ncbi:MAG: VanW family protein [Defluviitaleaceae bacterium]|nr:VanW family protein [Defluviitaleaceae bacterium]
MRRILPILVSSIIILIIAAGCADRVSDVVETDLASLDMELLTISEELGAFSTKFDPSENGRTINIELASDSINQTIVQSGEEFSYNKTIGPTTEKNGYQLAMIYVGGKKDEGFGGGVCQVSSTLYNAAANAGMTVTERHDHSLPVTYVEAGKEAATSYGVKDLRFINELSHPVIIHSHVENGIVSVSINVA